VEIDTSRWSGDGDFTQIIVERLREHPHIAGLRVEDAAASREDAGYSFISNEVFVVPSTATRPHGVRRWGVWPIRRHVLVASVTLDDIEALLTADAAIGPPDVVDAGMLQYLRTQRIVPAYQTRGYKLVELIRIYMAGTEQSP
jgi:hypothetical protein